MIRYACLWLTSHPRRFNSAAMSAIRSWETQAQFAGSRRAGPDPDRLTSGHSRSSAMSVASYLFFGGGVYEVGSAASAAPRPISDARRPTLRATSSLFAQRCPPVPSLRIPGSRTRRRATRWGSPRRRRQYGRTQVPVRQPVFAILSPPGGWGILTIPEGSIPTD